MENGSLLDTSWKILRHSKLAWFFSFLNYLFWVFIEHNISGSNLINFLFCGVDLIGFVIVSLCLLAITITLYHGYLGELVTG